MSRYAFEIATAEHDPTLRRLFAAIEMEGDIRISFQREPNYFIAAGLHGPFHQVVAARDTMTGEIIGVGTRAVCQRFINGDVTAVGYLADMRLDPRYRGGPLVARAYRYLKRLHADGRTQIYFTLIAEGNRRALDTIAAGRAGIPTYNDFGRILSPAVNLRWKKPSLADDIEIARGSTDLLPAIVGCLNRNYQRKQFAPCYALEHFLPKAGGSHGSSMRGFRPGDCYMALRGGKVVGVLGRWDQSDFKQTIITGYSGKIRALRPAYNVAARLMGYASYPRPGAALSFFHASFIAVDDDDLQVFRALLRELYNDHVGTGYNYFVVGLHERDPLSAALSEYALTPFAARLFVVHFDDGAALFRTLNGRVPYIELAML
jgi:hypothetical protein